MSGEADPFIHKQPCSVSVDDCPTISSALLIHEPRLCKEQKHPLIFETHKMRKGGGEEIDLRRIREGRELVEHLFGEVEEESMMAGGGQGVGVLMEGCDCWGGCGVAVGKCTRKDLSK